MQIAQPLTQFFVDEYRKAAENGSGTWASATPVENLGVLLGFFDPRAIGELGSKSTRGDHSHSLSQDFFSHRMRQLFLAH